MNGELDGLSPEELWRLFPIEISEPRDDWKDYYKNEYFELKRILGQTGVPEMHHIGSTSVPGLAAKPLIDILAVFPTPDDIRRAAKILEENSWSMMQDRFIRVDMCKGYSIYNRSQMRYHLHMRLPGDCDELYFRQMLCADEASREKYAALKRRLAVNFRYNRDAYTDQKTDLVRSITASGVMKFGGNIELYKKIISNTEVIKNEQTEDRLGKKGDIAERAGLDTGSDVYEDIQRYS